MLINKERIINVIDKFIEFDLYLLIFFLPISKAAIETFAGFAFLLFIVKKILNPEFKFLLSTPHFFLLVFITFNVFSLFNSGPYMAKSLSALFLKWLEYVGIFLFVEDIFSDYKRLRRLICVILLAGAVISIDGLIQYFFRFEPFRQRQVGYVRDNIRGITGPFVHYNDFGIYVVFLLSLVVSLLVSEKIRKRYFLLLLTLAGIAVAGLLLTFSRSSWLAFICALFFLVCYSGKIKYLLSILLIFVVFMLSIPMARERAIFTFDLLYGDADRFSVWKVAIGMIKDHPFLGIGVGTFMDHFRDYTKTIGVIQYAHNCYLQIWAETGIFSLASFILFTGTVLHKGLEAFKRTSYFWILGFIAAMFAFLVHIYFDTGLYSLQLAVLFWFGLGIIMGASRIRID